MKILFICTAFNSLAQRTALVLRERGHVVTVEYALSPEGMIEAAELAQPHLIICPFLTKHVPPKVYNTWMTLIVHPGPPGDAGPSALDWCLIGDMGEMSNADQQLALIDAKHSAKNASASTRTHWGVTVLQAIEAFDAGPVWAFDQFELSAETAAMSKSDLYRGPVTRAAVHAVLAAVQRITECARVQAAQKGHESYLPVSTEVVAPARFRAQCVSNQVPFLGGRTHDRPLLRASQRDFFPLVSQANANAGRSRLSADAILQRIRSADSQPGMLSSLLGTPLFLYNAHVQRDPLPPAVASRQAALNQPGTVLATREGAVLVDVGADLPIWIGHLRRPKAKTDKYLQPKLPAVMALLSMPEVAAKLGLMDANKVPEWSATTGFGADASQPWKRREGTYQQVWVDVESSPKTASAVAYVHADFYNGAFSTTQCEILLAAIQWTLEVPGLKAIVMLGGPGYFSNGIALNVIEGSPDPSAEGWANINAIDDCVQALLAPRGIVTFAAMRGNAAAGGLAMATAADFVICAESAVLNPHYRGLGLFGSEWHTYSWYERCGSRVAAKFAREMLPMSSHEGKRIGLVDHVLDNDGMDAAQMLTAIKGLVNEVIDADIHAASAADGLVASGAPWTRSLRPASADAAQSALLSEQIVRNKMRYLAYLFAENADAANRSLSIDEHFQRYRKHELDQMTLDFFHPHRNPRFASRCTGFVRKLVPDATPMRFALHRRYADSANDWASSEQAATATVHLDEEERDEFDGLGDLPASAAVARLPDVRPEFVVHDKANDALGTRNARAYSVGHDTIASAVSADGNGMDGGSGRTSMSTVPTTPRGGSPKPVFSIGDEEAQRVEIEAEQLKVHRRSPDAGLLGTNAVKRGPTAISFAGADDVLAAAKARTGVKVRSERSTAVPAPRPAPASATKEDKKPSGKIQRFFQSLSRKSRANLQAEASAPVVPAVPAVTAVPATSSAVAAQASEATGKSAPASPVRTSSRMDAASRQRRRSSISDVFSILQNGSRPSSANQAGDEPASPTSKQERRRSWRPTSSSGINFGLDRSNEVNKSLPPTPMTKTNGFQPNMTATPKILEEPFKDGVAAQDANCLWSCYYSEDGEKVQRPLVANVQAAPISA